MNYLALIPVVFQVIKAIEAAMPDSQGKQKFDAAIVALEQVYGDITASLPQITALINGFVSVLNAVGVFKRKA